jgi:thiosulfate reductase cytochrome b subunit
VVLAAVLAVLTGLSMWKPVQLHWLSWVFGGYPMARESCISR